MVIGTQWGGLGNNLFQYAVGRRLAYKLGTTLKFDKHNFSNSRLLDIFNVQADIATPEEIAIAKVFEEYRADLQIFSPQVLELPDNIYLKGYWENERYFADISDIIRKEFTLKKPLSPTANAWRQKILDAECAVSMHFRHGDFLTLDHPMFAVPPPDYHYTAFRLLAEPKATVFVFSDDIQWCKENIKLDVPTYFVEGCKDYEQLYLMSLCKHNIAANSTFSWWGAWLNQNPDKKVFFPIPDTYYNENKLYRHFTPTHYKYSSLDSDRWIRVVFDISKKLNTPPKKETPAPKPAIDYRDFYTAALEDKTDEHDLLTFNRQCL